MYNIRSGASPIPSPASYFGGRDIVPSRRWLTLKEVERGDFGRRREEYLKF
jgi:hypothetical protein